MEASTRNHALWAAPLLGIVGFLSYYTVFAQWAATRDLPWVNFLILGAAIVLGAIGVRRAWPVGAGKRVLGAFSLFVPVALTALLGWYAFVYSYTLPGAENALAVGAAIPRVGTLLDENGSPVDLAAASKDKLILVFYRGDW